LLYYKQISFPNETNKTIPPYFISYAAARHYYISGGQTSSSDGNLSRYMVRLMPDLAQYHYRF
jgi:hypothetical protein